MQLKSLIYNITHPILGMLRSNRLLIRRLFGVRVPRSIKVAYDPTTVALAHAVNLEAGERDHAFFEMGIGQAALVSLSLAMRRGVPVEGADCSQSRVQSSREVAQWNSADATFIYSDLFSSVEQDKRFDLIFFNVPYVPTAQGKQLQLTERLQVDGDQVWDGGDDGTDVLKAFLLESKDYLTTTGRVIFGVQNIFVPDQRITELLAELDYQLLRRVTKRWVPSCCYVVVPTRRQTQPANQE